MLTVNSSRFGPIDVDDADVIALPEGLVGFEDNHRFVLLEDESHQPFIWFQSVDDPDLCFILTDPLLFFPDYQVPVQSHDLKPIRLSDPAQARVLVILVVPDDPREATANLQGPLVINVAERLARQLVLLDERYGTRHRLMDSPALRCSSTPEKD